MRKFGTMIASCVLAFLFSADDSVAADFSLCPPAGVDMVWSEIFRRPPCDSYIWITGEVLPGDYAKFKEFLRDNMSTIVLGAQSARGLLIVDVSGDDYDEATSIGRLVNALELAVALAREPGYIVMNGDPPRSVSWLGEFAATDSTLATCRGACVVIWLAGVPRVGELGMVLESFPESVSATRFLAELDLPSEFVMRWKLIGQNEELAIDDSDLMFRLYNGSSDPNRNDCSGRPLLLCKDYADAERIMKLFSSTLSKQ